jgi:hypothetical protein
MKRWMGWLSMFQTALLMIFHKDNIFPMQYNKRSKSGGWFRDDNGEGGSRIEAPHYSIDKADDSASVINLCEI